MKRIACVLGVVALGLGTQSMLANPAQAQSENDFAAWAAMIRSPVGALAPVPVLIGEGTSGSKGLSVRYGRWQFAPGDDETSTYGVGLHFRPRTSVVRLEFAKSTNAQCSDCGMTMFGVDVTAPLKSLVRTEGPGGRITALVLSWNPVLGLAKADEGDGSALSAVLNLPVTLQMPLGSRWSVIPFIAPGYGFGLVSGGGESISGLRPLMGGGIAIANAKSTVQLSAGFRKILLEGAPSTAGFGVVLSR
jgi:hypothetical protein